METITPVCSVFGHCGGCAYQDVTYEEELRRKERTLRDLLIQNCPIALDVLEPIVPSPVEYYYRHRLDLKLQRTKFSGILMGYTPLGGRGILEVDACPIGMRAVTDFLPHLKEQAIARLPPKYRQASLVVRTGDDGRVFWGGIGRRSNQLSAEDYLWTDILGNRIYYSLDTFFQANLAILPELFRYIRGLDIWQAQPRFLDLYGGVGLFSIALNDLVSEVVLIENAGPSVKLARYNFQYHGMSETNIVEGDVAEDLAHYLDSEQEVVAMIDPPRAGLSDGARDLLSRAQHLSTLLYLSCHPESLMRDLRVFMERGWTLSRVIPFDFFPKTRHLETLVILHPGMPKSFV